MSTELRRELMPYKDFITAEQEQIFILKDEETYRLLSDNKYGPIFESLNAGPLTIKELVKAYNTIADTPRKQTSIYNYLMDLVNKKLILKAGQRIISGKTATEVLYGRRAKLYYSSVMTEEYWNTGQSKAIISKVNQLLTVYTLSEGLSEENLTSLFHKIFANFHSEVGTLFEEHSERVDEIVSPLNFSQLSRITAVLNMLMMVLTQEKYQEDLSKTFPSKFKKG
ncbi:MAG: hypothetical protein GOP50_12380 [Candidatus Heimdallarchaeota archaeon]|nr:hypothetical protein [Candidatus Heimdallarchaeota archaeon]